MPSPSGRVGRVGGSNYSMIRFMGQSGRGFVLFYSLPKLEFGNKEAGGKPSPLSLLKRGEKYSQYSGER